MFSGSFFTVEMMPKTEALVLGPSMAELLQIKHKDPEFVA